MENMLGLFRCGHYNEVALLLRWLLSEVSLYLAYIIVTMRVTFIIVALFFPFLATTSNE